MVVNEKIEMTLKGATKAWRRIPELMYRLYASAGRCIKSRSDITESLDEPKKLGIPTHDELDLLNGIQRVLVKPGHEEDKEKGDEPAQQREGIGHGHQDLAVRPYISPVRVLFISGPAVSFLVPVPVSGSWPVSPLLVSGLRAWPWKSFSTPSEISGRVMNSVPVENARSMAREDAARIVPVSGRW